jgi:hypothetical protein
MLKITSRYGRLAPAAIVLIVVVALLVASVPARASSPAAPTQFYQCTVDNVAAFTNRVHAHCTVPYVYNTSNIYWFAFCSTVDSATASRMLSVFTTAKALNGHLGLYFNPADTSGTSCGCGSGDCRVITGAEVRP